MINILEFPLQEAKKNHTILSTIKTHLPIMILFKIPLMFTKKDNLICSLFLSNTKKIYLLMKELKN